MTTVFEVGFYRDLEQIRGSLDRGERRLDEMVGLLARMTDAAETLASAAERLAGALEAGVEIEHDAWHAVLDPSFHDDEDETSSYRAMRDVVDSL